MTSQGNEKKNDIGPADEYKALREELMTSRKYVFERPLLILALVAASTRIIETDYISLLLVVLAALLLFNFWFTFDRLASRARITAYIQVELEERRYGRWVGWETCLREYRRWLIVDKQKKMKNVADILDKTTVPDAMTYYRPIYMLHIGLMALTIFTIILMYFRKLNWPTGIGAALALGIGICFIRYLYLYRPKEMRILNERNRVIWIKVFEGMQADGLK